MKQAGSRVSAELAQALRSGDSPALAKRAALLLVSNDPAILGSAQRDIARSLKIPLSLSSATNPSDVWAALNAQPPDLLILDSNGPGDLNALELLAALRREPASLALPVVVLVHNQTEAAAAAVWPRVKTLIKPFGPLDFCALLEDSLAP